MRLAITTIAVGLVLTACGSGDPGPTTPPANDPQQRGLQFAKCMREHGVDMPDPDPNNPGQIKLGGPGTDQQQIQAATQACRAYSPIGGNGPSSDSATQRQARLKFAACMREHGVENWPDPSDTGGAPGMVGPELTNDPDFETAAQACQSILRDAFGDTF